MWLSPDCISLNGHNMRQLEETGPAVACPTRAVTRKTLGKTDARLDNSSTPFPWNQPSNLPLAPPVGKDLTEQAGRKVMKSSHNLKEQIKGKDYKLRPNGRGVGG